jgi:hypothetical protein
MISLANKVIILLFYRLLVVFLSRAVQVPS